MSFLSRSILIACLFLGSCSTVSKPQEGPPPVECPVCKAEGDLACVDVRPNASTPTVTYRGKTYSFCSEECRDQFMAAPETYVETPGNSAVR